MLYFLAILILFCYRLLYRDTACHNGQGFFYQPSAQLHIGTVNPRAHVLQRNMAGRAEGRYGQRSADMAH